MCKADMKEDSLVEENQNGGISRQMLDLEPVVFDDQDVADIQKSLDQVGRGEVVDAKIVHAKIRKRFLIE